MQSNLFVKCLSTKGYTTELTKFKLYPVLEQDSEGFYCIVNDNNTKKFYRGERFAPITSNNLVHCINNSNVSRELTVGHAYEALVCEDDPEFYLIRNNIGETKHYHVLRFEEGEQDEAIGDM